MTITVSNIIEALKKCKFLRKTCYCKSTKIVSFSTESRFIKKNYIQINDDYAALNWLQNLQIEG